MPIPPDLPPQLHASQTVSLTGRLHLGSDPRTASAILLDTAEIGRHPTAGNIKFEPDSIKVPADDPERVKICIEHDTSTSCGRLLSVGMSGSQVIADLILAETPHGDDALSGIRHRTRDGISVGVDLRAAHQSEDSDTIIVTEALLRHVALCTEPVFTSATIIQPKTPSQPTNTIRNSAMADQTIPPTLTASYTQPDPPQQPQMQPQFSQPQQQPQMQPPTPIPRVTPQVRGPITLSTISRQIATMVTDGHNASRINNALSDILPADDKGKGFLPESVSTELWTMIPERRTWMTYAAQNRPLESAVKQNGWSWKLRPKVAAYEGNKKDIPSNKPETQLIEAPTKRMAGGWDIDRIYTDLGSPQLVESLIQMASADCIRELEEAVMTTVIAAGTAVTKRPTLHAALTTAALTAVRQGSVVDYVALSADLWESLATVREADKPWWYSNGTEGLAVLNGDGKMGGVPMFIEPTLPTATYVIGDKRAAIYWTASNMPIKVEAIDLPRGGVDIAVFGYYATVANEPRAILKGTVGAG